MTTLFAADHPWIETERAENSADGKLRIVRADTSASTTPPVATPELALPAGAAPSFVLRQVANESHMIEILDRGGSPNVLPSAAFRQKAHELGAVFASLTPSDSVELDRRLSVCSPDDPLASRFARLVPDRRARLIEFLRNARRRAVAKFRSPQ